MILAIIQARMGSSRLPGKVLMPLLDKPILGHLLDRLRPSKKVTEFVVATTTNPEDQSIVDYCNLHHVKVFQGSDWDVLDRFYHAALSCGAQSGDTIVRICCDNPLHSWKVMDQVITLYEIWGVDYCSNSNHEPDFLEDGFDVEVTSFDALCQAHADATLLSEREHVMPFIKNCGRFKLGWKKTNADYRFKFSVDTPEDFKMAETILSRLAHVPDFSIDEVTELILSDPALLEINATSTINSGYHKSLREDKKIL
jgi:spore coat polysaccharide biosynthesis protein SpsF (cytidylyltransferase family)